MARPVHIACLQTQPQSSIAAAIDEALPMAESAVGAGAQMLFLPEYCGGLRSEGARFMPPVAREKDHGFLAAIREFAAARGVWISLGSIAIEGAEDSYVNRGFMISDQGEITGRYDKIHLFDVTLNDREVYRESDTVQPGHLAVVHDTDFGRVGHTICYDLRFAGLYRRLAQSGADILSCPAAFTKHTGEAHWHVLNRARAIENTRFVVSACAVGNIEGGGACYGHSLVVGPWGEVLADGATFPGVVHAQIDLDHNQLAQSRVPSLTHDRPFDLQDISERSVA